jgi:hypothetical protein
MSTFFNKYTLVLLWILLFLISGVLFSGYHFVDDHEVYAIIHQLKSKTFSEVVESTLANDLRFRFRPFYYSYRILLIRLFGENFLFYYLHNLIVCSISSILLFSYATKLRKDAFSAFIFTIISIGGMGFAIYYRLGVNETMGILFVALGLNTSVNPKKTVQFFSFLCFFIASISKESFVLLIPILALWQINTLSSPPNLKQFVEVAKQKWIFLLAILIIALVELYIIKFKIGTNKMGYAGAPTGLDKALFINTAKSFFRLIIQNCLFFVFPIYLIYKKNNWQQHIIANSLIVLMLAAQFLIYAKSGMYERYLLPSSLVIGLFYLINAPINPSKGFRNISYNMAIWSIGMAFYQTNNYAKVGEENKIMLNEILNKTKAETPIVIAGTPLTNGEWILAMNRYFEDTNHQRNNIAYLVIPENFSKETIGSQQLPAFTFKQANQDLGKENFKLLITNKENEDKIIKNHNGKKLMKVFETKNYVFFE